MAYCEVQQLQCIDTRPEMITSNHLNKLHRKDQTAIFGKNGAFSIELSKDQNIIPTILWNSNV